MATTTDLISKINEKYGRMSKGQKLLANYIIDNYDKAVFLTAAKLGEILGISESTVVRFASFIGYSGYPEFQQALENMVRSKLNTADRVEVTKGGIEQNGVLREVLSSDALKIKNTMESMDEAAFYNAVETLLKARRIYVVGIRTCAPLASFLAFYLNLIFDNVVNLQTSSASELFEQMIHISEEDCIIGISFPRYSMRTLKALEFANNRQANVITITDAPASLRFFILKYSLALKAIKAKAISVRKSMPLITLSGIIPVMSTGISVQIGTSNTPTII